MSDIKTVSKPGYNRRGFHRSYVDKLVEYTKIYDEHGLEAFVRFVNQFPIPNYREFALEHGYDSTRAKEEDLALVDVCARGVNLFMRAFTTDLENKSAEADKIKVKVTELVQAVIKYLE